MHTKSSQTINKVPVNAQSCNFIPAVMDQIFRGHIHLSETPTTNNSNITTVSDCHQSTGIATQDPKTHLNIRV